MALLKTCIARGTTAEYFRIEALKYDRARKEISAWLNLYVDAAHAAAVKVAPIKANLAVDENIANVRLLGADFDAYFETGTADDDKLVQQTYNAMKAGVGVISDLGSDFFTDAADV